MTRLRALILFRLGLLHPRCPREGCVNGTLALTARENHPHVGPASAYRCSCGEEFVAWIA